MQSSAIPPRPTITGRSPAAPISRTNALAGHYVVIDEPRAERLPEHLATTGQVSKEPKLRKQFQDNDENVARLIAQWQARSKRLEYMERFHRETRYDPSNASERKKANSRQIYIQRTRLALQTDEFLLGLFADARGQIENAWQAAAIDPQFPIQPRVSFEGRSKSGASTMTQHGPAHGRMVLLQTADKPPQ